MLLAGIVVYLLIGIVVSMNSFKGMPAEQSIMQLKNPVLSLASHRC